MPIGDNRAAVLFDHIRALERFKEIEDDARADVNERRQLAKQDGFDTKLIDFILKRRKQGKGQTQAFDEMLREYEEAIDGREALELPDQPDEVRDPFAIQGDVL